MIPHNNIYPHITNQTPSQVTQVCTLRTDEKMVTSGFLERVQHRLARHHVEESQHHTRQAAHHITHANQHAHFIINLLAQGDSNMLQQVKTLIEQETEHREQIYIHKRESRRHIIEGANHTTQAMMKKKEREIASKEYESDNGVRPAPAA